LPGAGAEVDRQIVDQVDVVEQVRTAVVADLEGLYRFARLLTDDDHTAQDVVQETVARALASAHTFRGEATARTWLHRIAHNIVIDRSRSSRHEVPSADVDALWRDDGYTVDTAMIVERAADRAELEDALARLPAPQRTAVVLHDVERWTVAEIAGAVGIGLPAAKQRLRRGRMALVTALDAGPARRRLMEGTPMRCWDARRRISDYLDGDLTGPEVAQVEAHLERCPTCPPLLAALVGVHIESGRLRDPDTVVPQPLARRITAMVERTDPGRRSGA
jgi:RNA polymerase sigma-70 factor, ECF subfamily